MKRGEVFALQARQGLLRLGHVGRLPDHLDVNTVCLQGQKLRLPKKQGQQRRQPYENWQGVTRKKMQQGFVLAAVTFQPGSD